MIHIVYTENSFYHHDQLNWEGEVHISNNIPNRIWMSNEATLYDATTDFTIKGPQFMLLQLLFFLGVKIKHPHLLMEYQ